jgi:ATP-binding cassette subfamily F protein uup
MRPVAKQRTAAPAKQQQQRTHDTSKRKLSYKEQRELEQIETDLTTLGAERTELEAELSSGTLPYDRITEISKRIEELVSLIDEKEMRWLELNE